MTTVAEIKEYLPSNAEADYGWDDTKIAAWLDTFNESLPQTIRQFWLERVTETFQYVDITETASTRALSQVHQNAKAMLDYWKKQVDIEGLVSVRKPISFGTIDRT